MLFNSVLVALTATLIAGRSQLPARLPKVGALELPTLPIPNPASANSASSPAPTLVLDYGNFIGFNKDGVTNYLGVRFPLPLLFSASV